MAKKITVWLLVAILFVNPSIGMAEQCESAYELKLGETAPCDGQLLPDAMAADFAYWYEMGPIYKRLLAETRQDALILMQPTPPPPIEWYVHPAFWGVTMFVIGLSVGIGLKFGLDLR